jgi:hypothetical protein
LIFCCNSIDGRVSTNVTANAMTFCLWCKKLLKINKSLYGIALETGRSLLEKNERSPYMNSIVKP